MRQATRLLALALLRRAVASPITIVATLENPRDASAERALFAFLRSAERGAVRVAGAGAERDELSAVIAVDAEPPPALKRVADRFPWCRLALGDASSAIRAAPGRIIVATVRGVVFQGAVADGFSTRRVEIAAADCSKETTRPCAAFYASADGYPYARATFVAAPAPCERRCANASRARADPSWRSYVFKTSPCVARWPSRGPLPLALLDGLQEDVSPSPGFALWPSKEGRSAAQRCKHRRERSPRETRSRRSPSSMTFAALDGGRRPCPKTVDARDLERLRRRYGEVVDGRGRPLPAILGVEAAAAAGCAAAERLWMQFPLRNGARARPRGRSLSAAPRLSHATPRDLHASAGPRLSTPRRRRDSPRLGGASALHASAASSTLRLRWDSPRLGRAATLHTSAAPRDLHASAGPRSSRFGVAATSTLSAPPRLSTPPPRPVPTRRRAEHLTEDAEEVGRD